MTPRAGDAAREPCPSCGARLGGRAGCERTFEELQGLSRTSPARAGVHNLVVDVFAMQHTEEYGRSAKSYIAHLTALCCSVEAPGDRNLYRGIARWLDGPTTLVRPSDIATRGSLTIADAGGALTDAEYADVVRRWARDVWGAYADQHHMARQWLHEVRRRVAHGSR